MMSDERSVRQLQARITEAYFIEASVQAELPQAYKAFHGEAQVWLYDKDGYSVVLHGNDSYVLDLGVPGGQVLRLNPQQACELGYHLDKAWRIAQAGPAPVE